MSKPIIPLIMRYDIGDQTLTGWPDSTYTSQVNYNFSDALYIKKCILSFAPGLTHKTNEQFKSVHAWVDDG